MTSRANRNMSSRNASSRDIVRPLVFEYVAPADVIRTSLNGDFLDEIHVPSDNSLQLILHLDQVEQSPARRTLERHQDIDVAVIAKLAGRQNGSKEAQLRNPPFAAECLDRFAVEIERDGCVDAHCSPSLKQLVAVILY